MCEMSDNLYKNIQQGYSMEELKQLAIETFSIIEGSDMSDANYLAYLELIINIAQTEKSRLLASTL